MVNENKNAFWQALVVSVIILLLGIVLGYFLESSRVDRISFEVQNSEINLLDEQLRSQIVTNSNLSCDLAMKSTFAFADKIYEEAKRLELYESSEKFSEEMMASLHKRYDLLRMVMWGEGIKTKQKCSDLHTIVYFFAYESDDAFLVAKQNFFSDALVDLKNKYPDKILLIPIASGLDVSSVGLTMESYKLEGVPVILIDESKTIYSFESISELESAIFG